MSTECGCIDMTSKPEPNELNKTSVNRKYTDYEDLCHSFLIINDAVYHDNLANKQYYLKYLSVFSKLFNEEAQVKHNYILSHRIAYLQIFGNHIIIRESLYAKTMIE